MCNLGYQKYCSISMFSLKAGLSWDIRAEGVTIFSKSRGGSKASINNPGEGLAF